MDGERLIILRVFLLRVDWWYKIFVFIFIYVYLMSFLFFNIIILLNKS